VATSTAPRSASWWDQEDWDGDLRTVKTVKELQDITLATYPAYPAASVELRTHPAISKAGSRHARRLLVEAAHHYRRQPRVGYELGRRQRGQDPPVVNVAWRAQQRLHARWRHLVLERRKPVGVSLVALARELACFCWEAALVD